MRRNNGRMKTTRGVPAIFVGFVLLGQLHGCNSGDADIRDGSRKTLDAEQEVLGQADSVAILEAVVRSGWWRPGAEVCFIAIGIGGRRNSDGNFAGLPEKFVDPSDELMRRFRRVLPGAMKVSRSSYHTDLRSTDARTGKQATILFVGPIVRESSESVLVHYGLYRRPGSTRGHTYQLVKRGGRWRIDGGNRGASFYVF